MLQVSNEQQIRFLLYSVIVGVFLSFLYDFFKVSRVLFSKMPDAVIFVEDLIFTLICTVVYIIFIYAANLGIPRFFSALGAAVGFSICYFTLGKLLPKIYVKAILIILVPIKLLISGFVKILSFILCKITICKNFFKNLFIFAKKRNIIYMDIRSGRIFRTFGKD